MQTARIWVTVEYFHPQVASGPVDWDSALVEAIPKVRAASNDEQFRTAIAAMLGRVQDSETRVLTVGAQQNEHVPDDPQISVLSRATGTAYVSNLRSNDRTFVHFAGGTAMVRLSVPKASAELNQNKPPTQAIISNPYPSVEARILSAIKLWGAIRYFFAYKDLMDDDWDDILPTYLPKLIAASDALIYNLVLSDLLTHLTDTNAAPHSQTLDAYFGEATVGLQIRLLEKYPIVTDVLDPDAKAAGVAPGDVLKRIAGVSTTDVFNRLVQYVPASTPQRSGYDTIRQVANGPEGSEVELLIEDVKGESHAVKLKRRKSWNPMQPTEAAVRVLPGNIGYIDLERISYSDAESAFQQVKATKAIIFDLRAAAAPAAQHIAAHLVSQANVAAAFVTTPIALRPDIPSNGTVSQSASTFEVRAVPNPQSPHYSGKTIALIDERTIGEAEYAGLSFEAANQTAFYGEPSAGACCGTVALTLPGNVTVTYSTQDIRHANAGKLQRLGIQPNVVVPTTAKGLRVGKDEVLDAALAALQ